MLYNICILLKLTAFNLISHFMNLNIDKHIPHEKLSFVKMNGNGNDFVIFDSRLKNINFTKHDIKKISDRHFGVGCDQVILLENSSHADIFMRIYNSNGSEAQMCGNAAKCVAAMLFSSINQHTLKIETISGIIYAESKANGVVAVNMGVPKRNWEQIPISKNIDTSEINLSEINKLLIKGIALSMGNPHIVFIVPSHDLINLEEIGRKIETFHLFPEGVNIEIVVIKNTNHLDVKVWERGAGLTLSCGSGACAAFAATHYLKLCENKTVVSLPGGKLDISINSDGSISMSGTVNVAYFGYIPLKQENQVEKN